MSEIKLEDQLEEDWKAPTITSGVKKHTLDSDEEDEDEGKKYEIMEDDDIEGQEDGIAGFDGDVQITPFNMKEEMEEGHFDTEGNYHWKKEGKLIKDNWLENIDWVEIKRRKDTDPSQADPSDSDSDADEAPFDQVPHYRKMLTMMKPGETVAKALQRLGGKKGMSASERWRRKKAGEKESSDGDKQQVTELTACANTVLTETGNMDIYQETYEHILKLVDAADKKHAAAHPAPKNYADALDMYADDFDEKEKARLTDKKRKTEDDNAIGSSSPSKRTKTDADEPGQSSEEQSKTDKKHKLEEGEEDRTSAKRLKGETDSKDVHDETEKEETVAASLDPDSSVRWEFKWKQDSAEVEGPHPSEQMQAWVDDGRFKQPVWVRKVGQDGPFYSSSRVDFELYF